MPRRGKFFDRRSDSKAFGEGKHESKKAGFFKDLAHDFSKGLDTTVADTRSRQEKGYDAGWEEGKAERSAWRKKQRERSYSGGGSSGNGSGDPLGALIGIGLLVGLPILCVYIGFTASKGGSSGTDRSVTYEAPKSQTSRKATLSEKECRNLIKKFNKNPDISVPSECRDQYNTYLKKKSVQANQRQEGGNQLTSSETVPSATSDTLERDRQQSEAFQRYNSPEERRRREEQARKESELTPEQKQEAILRERKRQEDMQRNFDRLNQKYSNSKRP